MAVYTKVGDEELQRALAGFARFDRSTVVSARGVAAGSVNTNYAVDVLPPGEEVSHLFLRIYEEQGWEGARLDVETLSALASRGIPTPLPFVATSGERLVSIAGKPAALFPWVDGTIVCQARVTPAHLVEVGKALASVHVASTDLAEARDGGRFRLPDLLHRVQRIDADGGALAHEAPRLAASLREASSARRSLPGGLVHADLFRDNVLWRAASAGADPAQPSLAALLDFESAHAGPLAYDLATVFLSWCFGERFERDLARALTSGYESVRPLRADERAGLYDEAIFASLRFTVTRITDYAMRALTDDAGAPARVLKDWRRFAAREAELRTMKREGFESLLFSPPVR